MAGNFYSGTSPASIPWPGGVVPYQFTNTLTAAQVNTYLDGLREWELAANVKFVPRTDQTRWILFAYNTNFLDFVASGHSPQVITVSSLSRAQVCHEMGHSFGFTHENIRPDQADYLTVVTNNISNEASNIFWFTVDPTSVTNGYYDFESVMHLGWDFESIQFGVLPTQQPRPPYFPRYQFRMGNFCLSPGDRAALAYLYGPPAAPLTNLVTTTADAGSGSLRAALYYVTDHPGEMVKFNIPTNDPGYSNGVFNIHLTGQLPPLVTNGMVIDGSTQPGFTSKPLIVVDGSQIIPETFTATTGLLIYSANNQVKNVSFQGFNWNGLTLEYADATNNSVAGCWLGLDSTGSNAAPNAFQGILIDLGASRNTVGGTNVLARNVISGNSQYGVWISDTNTTGNVVLGNYIGTDASGSNAVANGLSGVFVGDGANMTVIGGTDPPARNVISGNTNAGIWITGAGSAGNTVAENFVGLNAGGTAAVPNTFAGMYLLAGAQSNLVENNVFSGQPSEGLRISDAGTSFNVLRGNYFGTDASGLNVVANGYADVTIFAGATSNTIGGTIAGGRNIIGGGYYGLVAGGAGTSANVIEGNYIGLGSDGVTPVPNFNGVLISDGATNNMLGGTTSAARNIISGNNGEGVFLTDPGTSGNFIEGNFIGTDTTGTSPLPNHYDGIYILGAASANSIGGATAAARNVISGNNGSGLQILGAGTAGNFIQGNYIGTDATGANSLANGGEGIYLHDGASGNFIGGTSAGAGNVISANTHRGIYAYGTNTSSNLIQGNWIGTAASGTNALGNQWDGVVFFDGACSNVVGLSTSGSGTGNTIAFNGFTGVYAGSDSSNQCVGDTIRGNTIFSNNYIGINLAGGMEDIYGVTANHPGGVIPGPNDLQNYPVITNAVADGATTTISGTLNSSASRSFIIDVYRNPRADPSGHGQGQIYAGSVMLVCGSDGNANFRLSASGNFSGQYFSATATDQTSGDTSEFSADVVATNAPSAPEFLAPMSLTSTGFRATISVTIGQSYHVQAATDLGAQPIVWTNLTNFNATGSLFQFNDPAATDYRARFYRVVSP